MATKHLFGEFTNQYPVSKTLRFELIPQGRTLEKIEQKGFINQDNQRAEDYKEVKEIIDEYHKDFIEKSLEGLKLEGLKEYYNLFSKITLEEDDKKQLEDYKKNLRNQVADRFKQHKDFKTLFKKDLIKKDLVDFLAEDANKKELVNKFSNFTTYFTGFHDNRKNMYTADENGVFFDSRNVGEAKPKDADANGAYHIALKGLLALDKINNAEDKNMKKLNLAISNKEWLGFAQN